MRRFALMDGVLVGDPERDGGCVWVEDAASGAAVPVVWPPGFTARFDPLELLGPDRVVVAREGDLIGFSGGMVEHEGRQRCDLGQDERWIADEVRLVSGEGQTD